MLPLQKSPFEACVNVENSSSRLVTRENMSLNCEAYNRGSILGNPGNKEGGCALTVLYPVWLEIWITESLLKLKKASVLRRTRQADVCLSAHWPEDACWHCPSARLAMGLVSVIDIDFDFE